MSRTLAVVGGGAAGLMAALRAAEVLAERAVDTQVVVLEAATDPGRKILVSGGGRCNILPMDETPGRFVSSSPARLVGRFLGRFPLRAERSYFEELLGGPLREEPQSRKLFPPGNQARDVRDGLLAAARRAGVLFRTASPAREITRVRGGFRIRLDSSSVEARSAILATGGRSVLSRGADGAGFGWAETLGHTVRPLFPALTPLLADGAPHAALAGISVEARVLAASGPERAEAQGGFLFTHRGYSGPAALDVSHVVERARLASRPFRVTVRFQGEADWDEALRTGSGTLAGFLRRRFPDRLATLLLSESRATDGPLHRLSREDRRAIAAVLDGLELPVTGTDGYRTAEVTGGGVALEEVDPGSGESRIVPGLHLAGEVLDAFGPIGGFNFQWAWATGRSAGEGAARSLDREPAG